MLYTKVSTVSIYMEDTGTVWYEGWYYTLILIEGSKIERSSRVTFSVLPSPICSWETQGTCSLQIHSETFHYIVLPLCLYLPICRAALQ